MKQNVQYFVPSLLSERYHLKFQNENNMFRKLFVPNLREVITFEVCIRDISSDVTLVLDVYGCIGKYQVTLSLHCLLGNSI